MQVLGFYEPGHFHAALTLRTPNVRIDRNVHLYASPGPDRTKFLELVTSFNSRAEQPTAWIVHTHGDAGPATQLEVLISEQVVTAVVIAGKNVNKMATIARIARAGIHVLGDKPWVTDLGALPDLHAATSDPRTAPALAMDIMTNQHDLIARLRRDIVRSPDLFGTFRADPSRPSIEIGSVHHLAKLVNGVPLQRPAWYYDVEVQGNGLVDIMAHMVDQVQWLLGGEGGGAGEQRAYNYDTDVELHAARTYETEVQLSLFQDSTGEAHFPESLRTVLRPSAPEGDGPLWAGGGAQKVLALAANGVLDYSLRGVRCRHSAEWRPREPPGGGDLHSATIRCVPMFGSDID
jgi:hypothetical protein